jgi:hypothetical protein
MSNATGADLVVNETPLLRGWAIRGVCYSCKLSQPLGACNALPAAQPGVRGKSERNLVTSLSSGPKQTLYHRVNQAH